jgi:hypothetical protein
MMESKMASKSGTMDRIVAWRTITCDGPEEAGELVLTHGVEGADAGRGEELEGADPAHLPPPVTIGREGDALRAPVQEPQRRHDGPRREGDVVGHGDLARGVRGRGHHHGDVPLADSHERTVAPREVAQGAVRGHDPCEVVQVADDRHRPVRIFRIIHGVDQWGFITCI